MFHLSVDLLCSTEWFFCATECHYWDTSGTLNTTLWEPRTHGEPCEGVLSEEARWTASDAGAIRWFNHLRWLITQVLHVFWVLTAWCQQSQKCPKSDIPSLRNQKIPVFVKSRTRTGILPLLPYSKGKSSRPLNKNIDKNMYTFLTHHARIYSSQIPEIYYSSPES